MTIVLILAAMALVLAFVEVALTPGFGLAGVCSFVCAAVCVVLVYLNYGWWQALTAVLLGAAVFMLSVWWISRSKSLNWATLHASIDSTAATKSQLSVKAGDTGRAVTRLALVGNARIGDKLVEVKSSGKFIPEGTSVRVVSVSEGQIIVEPYPAGAEEVPLFLPDTKEVEAG